MRYENNNATDEYYDDDYSMKRKRKVVWILWCLNFLATDFFFNSVSCFFPIRRKFLRIVCEGRDDVTCHRAEYKRREGKQEAKSLSSRNASNSKVYAFPQVRGYNISLWCSLVDSIALVWENGCLFEAALQYAKESLPAIIVSRRQRETTVARESLAGTRDVDVILQCFSEWCVCDCSHHPVFQTRKFHLLLVFPDFENRQKWVKVQSAWAHRGTTSLREPGPRHSLKPNIFFDTFSHLIEQTQEYVAKETGITTKLASLLHAGILCRKQPKWKWKIVAKLQCLHTCVVAWLRVIQFDAINIIQLNPDEALESRKYAE